MLLAKTGMTSSKRIRHKSTVTGCLLRFGWLSRAGATIKIVTASHRSLTIATSIRRRRGLLIRILLLSWSVHVRFIVATKVLILTIGILIAIVVGGVLSTNIIESGSTWPISTAAVRPILRELLAVCAVSVRITTIGLIVGDVLRMRSVVSLQGRIRSVVATVLSISSTVHMLGTARGVLTRHILT